jgi:hypothetical protein
VIGDEERAVVWFAFSLDEDARDGQVFFEIGDDGQITKVTDSWRSPTNHRSGWCGSVER